MATHMRRTHAVDAVRLRDGEWPGDAWLHDEVTQGRVRMIEAGALVRSNGHESLARHGDWIVRHENGDLGTMKHHNFVHVYEAAP